MAAKSSELETLFNERPAESGRDPFWVLVGLFALIIVVTHALEQARVLGWTATWFGRSWEYVFYICRDSSDLAFASLIVLVIWFGLQRHWVFGLVVLIGILNWFENELIRRTFFDGYIRTLDWWEWESIDSSMTVVIAIATMPVVRWLTKSKQVFTNSISIADILLLTTAVSVLIVASNHLATLSLTIGFRGKPLPQFISFVGWDPTIEHLFASALLAIVAVVVVYVSCFGNLVWGVVTYAAAWALYLVDMKLIEVVKFKPRLVQKPLEFKRLWHGEFDHYVFIATLFLFCILLARISSKYWSRQRKPL